MEKASPSQDWLAQRHEKLPSVTEEERPDPVGPSGEAQVKLEEGAHQGTNTIHPSILTPHSLPGKAETLPRGRLTMLMASHQVALGVKTGPCSWTGRFTAGEMDASSPPGDLACSKGSTLNSHMQSPPGGLYLPTQLQQT